MTQQHANCHNLRSNCPPANFLVYVITQSKSKTHKSWSPLDTIPSSPVIYHLSPHLSIYHNRYCHHHHQNKSRLLPPLQPPERAKKKKNQIKQTSHPSPPNTHPPSHPQQRPSASPYSTQSSPTQSAPPRPNSDNSTRGHHSALSPLRTHP